MLVTLWRGQELQGSATGERGVLKANRQMVKLRLERHPSHKSQGPGDGQAPDGLESLPGSPARRGVHLSLPRSSPSGLTTSD